MANKLSKVGVGSDGVGLEIPKYIPIFKEPDDPGDIVVPRATPLSDPDTVVIQFRLPHGTFGPMVVQGMWLMLAVPASTGTPANYPLIWADPDAGLLSDSSPTALGPPSFLGCQEGPNFLYTLTVQNNVIAQFHHSSFKDNWRILPLPVELPDGANAELAITRLKSKVGGFVEDDPVYLFAGIFGRQRQIIPPPFDIDSCEQPVRPIAYTTGRIAVPTSATGTGIMGPPVSVDISLTNRHPTIIDEIVLSGMQHVYIKISYELGFFMTDFIPGRVLNFLHGGRTPAPILMNAPTRMTFELAQPLVVASQPEATVAIDIAGGAYGF